MSPRVQRAPKAPYRRRLRRLGVCAVLFLAALAAWHFVGDFLFGEFPQVPVVSEKLDWFARHRDDYDTVFVGSSRTYNQVSPAIFDARLEAAGLRSRSFNLGVTAMRAPESWLLLDRALALRPRRLRLVVVELTNLKPRLEKSERDTVRTRSWHRPRETAFIIAATGASHDDVAEKARWLPNHLLAFVRAFLHVGDGHDAWLRPRLVPPARANEPPEGLGVAGDGWAPTSKEKKGAEPEYRAFAADPAAWRRRVEAMREDPPAPENDPNNPLLAWALPRVVERWRKQGVETVFFIPPVDRRQDDLRKLATAGVIPALLDLNDPVAYPELYEMGNRADAWHLDEDGSRIFSRLLAERVIEWNARSSKFGTSSKLNTQGANGGAAQF